MPSEVGTEMLNLVAKRSRIGADREVFFSQIRGLKYTELERELLSLERDGFITIEWVGPSNFTVFMTPKGEQFINPPSPEAPPSPPPETSLVPETSPPSESPPPSEAPLISEDTTLTPEQETPAPEPEAVEEAPAAEEAETQVLEQPVEEEQPVDTELDILSEEPASTEKELDDLDILLQENGLLIEEEAEDKASQNDNAEPVTVPPPPSEEITMEEPTPTPEVKEKPKPLKPKKLRLKRGPVPLSKQAKAVESPQQETSDVVAESETISEIEISDLTDDILSDITETDDLSTKTDVLSTTSESNCIWERGQDCPFLKDEKVRNDPNFTQKYCIVCQLIEIKHLLKK